MCSSCMDSATLEKARPGGSKHGQLPRWQVHAEHSGRSALYAWKRAISIEADERGITKCRKGKGQP